MGAFDPLLSLKLSADYPGRPVFRDLSLQVKRGEIMGLVGQSGSGKSTLALSILRLLEYKGGSARGAIHFRERDLMALSEDEMRKVRGREIGFVPQSPIASLNPGLRIGAQLREAWKAHAGPGDPGLPELLESVSLPTDEFFQNRYPRQLSVGLAQRVLIAMAILHKPALLIADEPTSALDSITQSEILQLFSTLNRNLGTAVLYISHDLQAVASICHRVAILHGGSIVELDNTESIFRSPAHPYTHRLIEALPGIPGVKRVDKVSIIFPRKDRLSTRPEFGAHCLQRDSCLVFQLLRSRVMECQKCGKTINLIRAISNQRYCCDDHRWSHLEELNRLGLALLLNPRPELVGQVVNLRPIVNRPTCDEA